ncbi:putative 4-hydroxy-4-methyl-2-oxoglutarate aldolase [Catenovulum sp. 2E275]|uniref:putative 4-hydroxy-4-methyl-2-oxoglutarate aldolase n=1 Tax=Catenovulum sp. 2E275 TaxID=2980497 RepID=UPI0021D0D264|nr:putative 4-hydroxy-4-methyl-2-oxoglutarate aldolase [Catenovulum sp. 2E275]MCU4677410.1 putative 4-hydroxy-4-methyl-2-oxoglutarate aldolase [Catenovulum sp. 2E275]
MTQFATPDLFDDNRDTVRVASSGLHHFGGNKKFSGQAVTVNCPLDNSTAVEMLKQNGAGKVLIINGFATKQFAFLGDQMADNAVKNGWQGIIVNACVRDIEILRTMPLGVMALGCVPASTIKKGVGETNISISMLDTVIHPNDWIYADENGVIISTQALL